MTSRMEEKGFGSCGYMPGPITGPRAQSLKYKLRLSLLQVAPR